MSTHTTTEDPILPPEESRNINWSIHLASVRAKERSLFFWFFHSCIRLALLIHTRSLYKKSLSLHFFSKHQPWASPVRAWHLNARFFFFLSPCLYRDEGNSLGTSNPGWVFLVPFVKDKSFLLLWRDLIFRYSLSSCCHLVYHLWLIPLLFPRRHAYNLSPFDILFNVVQKLEILKQTNKNKKKF